VFRGLSIYRGKLCRQVSELWHEKKILTFYSKGYEHALLSLTLAYITVFDVNLMYILIICSVLRGKLHFLLQKLILFVFNQIFTKLKMCFETEVVKISVFCNDMLRYVVLCY
jgi:hypothetical protein